METVLFLAIISVCPVSVAFCDSADDWTRYISAPFEIEASLLQEASKMDNACTAALDKLKLQVDMEGSYSHLCVREDLWRKHHPEYD
tara:strand:+ start:285 stop:545 length:261 start_codon:yes stop_codon:yes gene_type:complete